jgi:hypothetical protein
MVQPGLDARVAKSRYQQNKVVRLAVSQGDGQSARAWFDTDPRQRLIAGPVVWQVSTVVGVDSAEYLAESPAHISQVALVRITHHQGLQFSGIGHFG